LKTFSEPFRPSLKDPVYEIDPRSTLDSIENENNNTFFRTLNETSSEEIESPKESIIL